MKIAIAWYAIGYLCFIYHWTRDSDLSVTDAFFGLIPALLGPIAFVTGFFIHGDSGSKVLLKKRGAK